MPNPVRDLDSTILDMYNLIKLFLKWFGDLGVISHEEPSTMLQVLADETRLQIVCLLLHHDFCVGALANRIGISPAAASQHLQLLRRAGLVRGEKRGYWTHYVVERSALHRIADFLSQLATTPRPDVSVCSRMAECTGKEPERRETDVCTCCCKRPERLKERPEKCSPEQIKECHGDAKDHPCEKEKQE